MCDQKETLFERRGTGIVKGSGFFALGLIPVGASRTAYSGPACSMPGLDRRSACVLAEPYTPSKRAKIVQVKTMMATGSEHYSPFDRTDLSPFDRTTTLAC